MDSRVATVIEKDVQNLTPIQFSHRTATDRWAVRAGTGAMAVEPWLPVASAKR